MERLKDAIVGNVPFWVLTIAALLMLGISMAIPPEGEIHKSVLEGVAELIGIMALWTVIFALRNGTTATIKHNGTEVHIDGDGK